MKRFLNLDWDAIAGIVVAVTAVILHFLHIADEKILLPLILVLLALLFIREVRHENKNERTAALLERADSTLTSIKSALNPPDVVLIGPRHLRIESERFARTARGEIIWFNVCLLMFKPQPLFDTLLRPAIENPLVTAILFILDEGERAVWQTEVMPKITACRGFEKVGEPRWCKMRESVSFILADTQFEGETEALLSFWGEPFMARAVRDVPRYIFHVQRHSELVARLTELERSYRFQALPLSAAKP
jgi:hypothetical protein